MATMYIALEIGIGLGAFLAGWLFADQVQRIPQIFFATAAITVTGYIYLLVKFRTAGEIAT
jgi:predicted MFS family arabinose efflux permease